eukprot:11223059-Lingulodinium_polyedra.AAC.1
MLQHAPGTAQRLFPLGLITRLSGPVGAPELDERVWEDLSLALLRVGGATPSRADLRQGAQRRLGVPFSGRCVPH